ncbi:hypothetical protein M406DRAFT_334440 [Cryphonectria parasitica EP155]|uniref:Uncharacterized protein n=1 Tax=Cryphonectria parasitica (strain ATCC 38755 / EP155) TaxID=660469 RepID=A0A9P5CKC9_CRYP1|nr:uncharacterized protein M406DRAFT_334440 [Cryphonectria parasitica EP155]KAF3760821.1 hypothetical protein M406DRAFT_334440 [Cryphonectria parasitica EP155]
MAVSGPLLLVAPHCFDDTFQTIFWSRGQRVQVSRCWTPPRDQHQDRLYSGREDDCDQPLTNAKRLSAWPSTFVSDEEGVIRLSSGPSRYAITSKHDIEHKKQPRPKNNSFLSSRKVNPKEKQLI